MLETGFGPLASGDRSLRGALAVLCL